MRSNRLGRMCLRSSQRTKRILLYAAGLFILIFIAVIILKKSSISLPLDVNFIPLWFKDPVEEVPPPQPTEPVGQCSAMRSCPAGTFSFSLSRGADKLLPPQICIQNLLVVGHGADSGVHTVVLNGKTGKVAMVQSTNMLGGEAQPLVEFLQGLEKGNIVLMATYDEPATKFKAGHVMGRAGRSPFNPAAQRDSWVLVGGKQAQIRSSLDKHNNEETNLYVGLPMSLELEGCIPRSNQ